MGVEVEVESIDVDDTEERRSNIGVEAPGEVTERGSERPTGGEES